MKSIEANWPPNESFSLSPEAKKKNACLVWHLFYFTVNFITFIYVASVGNVLALSAVVIAAFCLLISYTVCSPLHVDHYK